MPHPMMARGGQLVVGGAVVGQWNANMGQRQQHHYMARGQQMKHQQQQQQKKKNKKVKNASAELLMA